MSWSELGRWWATRMPWRVFGSLALFLPIVARTGLPHLPATGNPWLVLGQVLLTWLWLAQLRLVDDLFDREYDRIRHPERVLVRATSTTPFLIAAAVAGAVALAATAWLVSPRAAVGLFLLEAGLLLFYALSRRLALPRLGHVHGVLLKYPAMVYLLAGAPAKLDVKAWCYLAFVYLGTALYEMASDPELRPLAATRVLRVAETLLLLFAAGWIAIR